MRTGPNRLHGSAAEELLALHLRGLGITGWVPEYRFDALRRFRWDFAWPSERIAVEVQGGIWRRRGGAHTGTGAVRDCEKLSLGAILGWRVLVVTTDQVRSGQAVGWIQAALAAGASVGHDRTRGQASGRPETSAAPRGAQEAR